MKQVVIFTGAIWLLLNVIIGYSIYDKFNLWLTSGTIVWTVLALCFTYGRGVKDGFKIALTMLLMLFGIAEFVLAIFAPTGLENNPMLVSLIVLFAIQIILLFIINTVSRKIK